MEIAVCDNDENIRDDIARLISRQKPEASLHVFDSKDKLLRSGVHFSVVFLDVKGVSGMEIARELRRREEEWRSPRSVLVFITGYREYMEEAFDVMAFYYLLKPIDTDKFSNVLERACKEAEGNEAQEERYLMFKASGTTVRLALKEILFIESSGKKVIVHAGSETYEVYGTMEGMEEETGETFYRSHRGFLVNMAKIASYKANTIYLENGQSVLLSRQKYADFVKKYMRYAAEQGGKSA